MLCGGVNCWHKVPLWALYHNGEKWIFLYPLVFHVLLLALYNITQQLGCVFSNRQQHSGFLSKGHPHCCKFYIFWLNKDPLILSFQLNYCLTHNYDSLISKKQGQMKQGLFIWSNCPWCFQVKFYRNTSFDTCHLLLSPTRLNNTPWQKQTLSATNR